MKRRGDYLVYLAMRAALAVVRLLPRPLALAAGGLLGGGARLLGLRRAVTDDNLARAFPELGAAGRTALARGVFRHFGRMAVDSLRLSSDPRGLVPLVRGAEAAELIRARLKPGRGVIILTGHIGNWELAGGYIAALGIPLAAVVKPPSNSYVAAHTESVRRALGMETIPMPRARSGVLDALRQGKAVALVADQGALRSETWVPFFGQPTMTPAGPGLFAARSGAPVVFGILVAEGSGYRLEVEVLDDAVTGDARAAIEHIAVRYRQLLEGAVRRFPDQYLWTHRLWKRPPPPVPAARPAGDAP